MKKLLIVLLAAVLFTGCGNTKKENSKEQDNVKAITEKDVIKDQVVDGLKLTNTSLTSKDGIWTLVTEVTNNTGSDYSLNGFTIIMKDSNDNTIKTLKGYVGENIPNGSTKLITSSTDFDLSKVTKVEYEVKK